MGWPEGAADKSLRAALAPSSRTGVVNTSAMAWATSWASASRCSQCGGEWLVHAMAFQAGGDGVLTVCEPCRNIVKRPSQLTNSPRRTGPRRAVAPGMDGMCRSDGDVDRRGVGLPAPTTSTSTNAREGQQSS